MSVIITSESIFYENDICSNVCGIVSSFKEIFKEEKVN